ncbi:MAG: hypothetical protein H0X62_01725 [Bacteroidetes bacterium]|nr:hypothetical protein [Bacteroidota bacterium]
MIADFEHKGLWFLPSDTTTKVAGTIKFEVKKGLTLDLIGSFPRKSKTKELIWGILENGKNVTLFNNFEISRSLNLPGLEIAKYTSIFLLVGAYFTSKRDIAFNKVSVHYSHLDEWLNINSGFKKIEINPKDYKILIEYELPNPIDVLLDSKTRMTVNLVATPPSMKAVQKDVAIKQKAFIDFNYKRKTSFDKVLENTFHFQNFMTLALQRPTYHKEVNAKIKIKGSKVLHDIQIYFQVNNLPEEEKELHPIDILINYKLIAAKFTSVIKSWYDKKNKLETVTDPFFSTYYNPFLYTTDKFLNLARSIEAFHRDNIRRTGTNRQRFTEVFSQFSRQFNPTLKIKSKTKFISTILKYRNDYTHSNPILKSKDKRFLDLHYLSEKIQLIVTCALLSEINLTEKEIKAGINNTSLYTHLRYKLK